MTILYAIILGGLFGFVLQRIGAADSDKILDMLRLRNMGVAKAIMLGIGLGSALIFAAKGLGWLDPTHFSVKSMYWGVIIGGALLGLGWAISGFCPGTGVAALATGRKDSWFFVAGGLAGAGLFAVNYESLQDTWLFTELLGGKVTIADTGVYDSLIDGHGVWVALAISALMIIGAFFMPEKIADKS